MRDIKFRFWDTHRTCMVDWDYIKSAPMTHLENEMSFPPMQYTGLKDKNGKEIYEGDILKFIFKTKTKYPKGTIHYHEVVWNEVKAKWTLKRTDEKGNIHFVGLGKVDLKEHEIAGNSKENPELLGGRK